MSHLAASSDEVSYIPVRAGRNGADSLSRMFRIEEDNEEEPGSTISVPRMSSRSESVSSSNRLLLQEGDCDSGTETVWNISGKGAERESQSFEGENQGEIPFLSLGGGVSFDAKASSEYCSSIVVSDQARLEGWNNMRLVLGAVWVGEDAARLGERSIIIQTGNGQMVGRVRWTGGSVVRRVGQMGSKQTRSVASAIARSVSDEARVQGRNNLVKSKEILYNSKQTSKGMDNNRGNKKRFSKEDYADLECEVASGNKRAK